MATHSQLGAPLTSPLAVLVAFNSDGRTLTTIDYDGIIRTWTIFWRDHTELQSQVCGLLGSGLSRSEWKRYAAGIAYHQGCP